MFSSDGTLISASAAPYCGCFISNFVRYPDTSSELYISLLPTVLHAVLVSFNTACTQSGELRTQKSKSHLLTTQSLKVLPLKPRVRVGQYIAIHATLTARISFFADFYFSGPFICIFSKPLPSFSCFNCG